MFTLLSYPHVAHDFVDMMTEIDVLCLCGCCKFCITLLEKDNGQWTMSLACEAVITHRCLTKVGSLEWLELMYERDTSPGFPPILMDSEAMFAFHLEKKSAS